MTTPLKEAAQLLGRKGGHATKGISTPAKTAAARENGKKGGRPRVVHRVKDGPYGIVRYGPKAGMRAMVCGKDLPANSKDFTKDAAESTCPECLKVPIVEPEPLAAHPVAPVETPPDATDPDGWY